MGLMVTERQFGCRHTEYNGAGAVNDQVRGSVRRRGSIRSTGLARVSEREVDGRATLTVKCAGPVAYERVEVCARRVGGADAWVVKAIRGDKLLIKVETMFVARGPPVDLEAVLVAGGVCVGPATQFKT